MTTLVEMFIGEQAGVREPTRLLHAAETNGGIKLRQLAEYYLDGKLPEGETVQTLCAALSQEPKLRPLIVSLTLAAEERALDAWSVKHGHGAYHLMTLKKDDPEQFKRVIDEVMGREKTVAGAARALGIGLRTMYRYVEEVG